MNKQIQTLMDFIQQNENISAEEKSMLVREVNKVSSDLEIAEFKLERTEKVKRTTAILLEETIEELEQKRKAVEGQNRDLEIESSLERVRTVAMSMRKPDDMLEVCRIISQQSESLGIKEIRNVQTAIIYESKGTYLNYEYYSKHDKLLVTEVDYKNHELQSLFANQMLRGAEELFSSALTGKEVQDWYDYQKTTNQFADSYLENAQSLNYYFYSLGPVALGISTYAPLSEEEIRLFKRFRNVFDLAYRRFLDIEKAEAQAREAKIEASLERVRAQALSMRKPDDLPGICEVLFTELLTLGFAEIRNAMINIHDDEKASFVNYDFSDEIGQSINHLQYNIHPLIEKQVKQVRSAEDAFSVTSFAKEDLKDWIAFRKKIGEKDDPRIENTDALYYYFYSIGTGSIGISTFSSITEEKLGVLKRFRNVFDFAYRRYTDVAQAEAQAREAQIELALERVRARTMAMYKSSELNEVAAILFEQIRNLGGKLWGTGFALCNVEAGQDEFWFANELGVMPPVTIPNTEDEVHRAMYQAWKEKKDCLLTERGGEELALHYQYLNSLPQIKAFFKPVLEAGYEFPNWQQWNAAYFSLGYLLIITTEPYPEPNVLKRFAKVFEQTYTRFLDLQKAEAQAREAKIQLALERIRARTMAMQNSSELAEVSYLLNKQVVELGIPTRGCAFNIYNERDSSEWFSNLEGTIPVYKTPRENIFLKYFEAGRRGETLLIEEFGGERIKEHYKYLATLPVSGKKDGPIASVENAPAYQIDHVAYFKYGYLLFITLVPAPEAHEVFKRFAKEFEQTYTRFLDLKKAEEQARESQVEAALERVRSRTMGMQRSEELQEAAVLLFQQVIALGVPAFATGFNIWDEDRKSVTAWMGGQDRMQPPFKVSSSEDIFLRICDSVQKGESLFVEEQGGEALKKHYEYMKSIPVFKEIADKMASVGQSFPRFQVMHSAFFSQG
jgi:hypothetical protein